MTRTPNVLWIMTDEQRPDSLGCYGSDWARTPNLDRLARQGTVFRECHVQSPMCVPSRTSMLTGRYPQQTGVFQNDKHDRPVLDPELETFPQLFAGAGYRTASLGKWHAPRHPIWQELDDFSGFYDVADPVELGPGYSERDHRVVKNPGSFMDTIEVPVIIGGIYPHHDWGADPASHLTDLALEWLREVAATGQPFLLRVSFVWPHTPVLVPRPWDTLYAPDEVPCAALDQDALAGRAAYDRWIAGYERGMDMPMAQWRQAAADYYALCAYVDHQVGRLMHQLDRLGIADDTVVVYNADHGRNMGEMGMCQKATFDPEVWRVPFLVSLPGRVPAGAVRDDLCEAIDLGRTLLGLAGIEPDPGMQGRDLFASDEPEAVFGVTDLLGYRRVGVRTRRYRYDCTYAFEGERCPVDRRDPNLFDLQHDPDQRTNLAGDAATASVERDLYERLHRWMSVHDQEAGTPT